MAEAAVFVHPSALRTAASAVTAGVPPKLQSVYSGPFSLILRQLYFFL